MICENKLLLFEKFKYIENYEDFVENIEISWKGRKWHFLESKYADLKMFIKMFW